MKDIGAQQMHINIRYNVTGYEKEYTHMRKRMQYLQRAP